MAPRQLQLELNEVDMTADKGSKRVRVDRANESSMQSEIFALWRLPPTFLRSFGSLVRIRMVVRLRPYAGGVQVEGSRAGSTVERGGT
eukprot:scaffold23779_cov112-Isochrysis_galbana.AAC.1